MKRILVIDDAAKEKIAHILDYAEDHRYDPSDKSAGWESRIPGRNPNLQCMLYDGYRCVFSYTLGPSKSVYYRHLSISVPNNYPAPAAVLMIAGLFGFTGQPTGADPIPQGWRVEIRNGNGIDDPCIIVAQEREQET